MRKEFLKYMILIVTILPYCCQINQQSNELHALKRYYGHVTQAFFISVGNDQRMKEALSQQLRGWKSITLHEDVQSARYWLKNNYQYQNLILQSDSSQQDDQSRLKLSQICQSYFPQRPRLMIITNVKKHLPLVLSNDWNSQICAPQIIFLIEREDISQQTGKLSSFLKDSGYISNPKMKELSIFIKISDLLSINPHIRANDQLIRDKKINFFSKSQHFAQLYSSIFPNATFEQQQTLFPKKIYQFHMENSLLSIPDVIQASLYFEQEERPIVVYNYRGEKDSIYVGRSNFTIQSLEVDDYLFKHVEIIQKNKKNHHIYVLMSEGFTNLTITLEDGTQISEIKNLNQEKAQYLRGCTAIEQSVKIVIQNRKRSKWPIDPFFPSGDPRRHVADDHLKYHQHFKNVNSPLEEVQQIIAEKQQQEMMASPKATIMPEKPIKISQTHSFDHNKQVAQFGLPANNLLVNERYSKTQFKQNSEAERISKQQDHFNQQIVHIKQAQSSSNQMQPQVGADQLVSQIYKLQKQQITYIIVIVVLLIISASFLFNRLKKRQSPFKVEKKQQLSTSDDYTFGQYSDRSSRFEQT